MESSYLTAHILLDRNNPALEASVTITILLSWSNINCDSFHTRFSRWANPNNFRLQSRHDIRLSKPKPLLSKFVDDFWLYEGYEPEHNTDRILPAGTPELVINLRQNELLFDDNERPENCSVPAPPSRASTPRPERIDNPASTGEVGNRTWGLALRCDLPAPRRSS
jgi:hypothetical protein